MNNQNHVNQPRQNNHAHTRAPSAPSLKQKKAKTLLVAQMITTGVFCLCIGISCIIAPFIMALNASVGNGLALFLLPFIYMLLYMPPIIIITVLCLINIFKCNLSLQVAIIILEVLFLLLVTYYQADGGAGLSSTILVLLVLVMNIAVIVVSAFTLLATAKACQSKQKV